MSSLIKVMHDIQDIKGVCGILTYSEILNEYILKSGKTLDQIAKECMKKGVNIHSTYISKLRLGQRPAPSDDISRALAEVTGGDPDKLIMAGYIERAPKEVQGIIAHYLKNLDLYAAYVAMFLSDELSDIDENDSELLKTKIEEILERFKLIPIEQRIDFVISHFNRIVDANPQFMRDLGQSMGVSNERIESTIQTIKEGSLNRVKVYDLINDELYDEWVPVGKIRDGEYVYVICPDESMIGANITKGARLLCKTNEEDHEIESGKIYVLVYKDEFYVRRVFIQEDNSLILQSENSKYPPIIVKDPTAVEFIGIVKSVEFTVQE